MPRSYNWLASSAVVLLSFGAAVNAQAQSLIDASRRIDWSHAGVTGGIPNRTTVCATLNPGATAAQINSALAACPAGQVVRLNAGTYNLSSGIDFAGRSNVTLRGAGADQTFLVFTGGVTCGGMGADVCIRASQLNNTDSPGNTANWTAGYSPGTTSITLSNTANLRAGTLLILDQLDDTSDSGEVFVCQTAGVCSTDGPGGAGRRGRGQQQIVKVTAVNGNTVTITPGIYMPNWRSGQSPGAWWSSGLPIVGSGLEDVSVNHAGSGTARSGIYFFNAYDCWVKGVKSLNANRNHVWLYQSAHATVRDSYFYGTLNAASQSYGVESYMSSDALVENNIFQHITAPLMTGGSTTGSVFAYNYAIDDYYNVSANWMQASFYLHAAGNNFLLFEGNEGPGFNADTVHGTAQFVTLFRNVLLGWEPGKTAQTIPVHIYAFNRYFNVIGNVLGRPSYHTRYESAPPSGTGGNTSIYTVGWSGNGGSTAGSIPNDTRVKNTLFRWGNYDVVTQAPLWNPAEVPSGLARFANAVPVNLILPPSLYLSARPYWWGGMPWPPAGPEIADGLDPTARAHFIPARICFDSSPRSGGVLTFNAARCYPTAQSVAPRPPSNVRVLR